MPNLTPSEGLTFGEAGNYQWTEQFTAPEPNGEVFAMVQTWGVAVSFDQLSTEDKEVREKGRGPIWHLLLRSDFECVSIQQVCQHHQTHTTHDAWLSFFYW